MTDLTIRYSFGGSEDDPLVRREVPFHPPAGVGLQEALLERTDLLIKDLCEVFDGAYNAFAEDAASDHERAQALSVMAGTVIYATKFLALNVSVKYALFFERIQALFRALEVAKALFGAGSCDAIIGALENPWKWLKEIDDYYAGTLLHASAGQNADAPAQQEEEEDLEEEEEEEDLEEELEEEDLEEESEEEDL